VIGLPRRAFPEGSERDSEVESPIVASNAATNPDNGSEPTRRDMLFLATGAAAAVGVGAAVWPFLQSLAPDAETIAAGAPVEMDLSPIAAGQTVKVFWRGKLIFVRHRTADEIKAAQDVNVASLRDPQPDSARVKEGHAPWLVVYGNCTHLGCVPLGNQGQYNGWFCPCHGSVFDTSGRVRGGPAPINLPIPPYTFVSDTKIRIGEGAVV
jgi:ubiquinol-cytochrome c reductase iron-sulfur subunit